MTLHSWNGVEWMAVIERTQTISVFEGISKGSIVHSFTLKLIYNLMWLVMTMSTLGSQWLVQKICQLHSTNIRGRWFSSNSKKLTKSHKYKALNGIITDITLMTEVMLEEVQRKIHRTLEANDIYPTDVIGLNDVFQDTQLRDPFHSLTTEHLPTKYCLEHMGTITGKGISKHSFL